MRGVGAASIKWLHRRTRPVDCRTDGVISVQTATVKAQGWVLPDARLQAFITSWFKHSSIQATSNARTHMNHYPVVLRGEEFFSLKDFHTLSYRRSLFIQSA